MLLEDALNLRRFGWFLMLAIVAGVTLLRAASGAQAPSAASREDAYRANNVGVAYLGGIL